MSQVSLNMERLPNFMKVFGPVRGAKAFSQMHFPGKQGQIFSVGVGDQKIWLRRTASDTGIFFQIFIKREYETRQWSQDKQLSERYEAILASGRTPVIIDAGANIGLAALWFHARYPKAKIYAVEPDDANMDMLRRNVAGSPSIVLIQGALWDRPAKLKIETSLGGGG